MYCQRILLGSVLIFANALWAISQEPISPLLSSFPAYQQHKRETTFNLDWISLGPTFNSARADAIQLDPTHSGTMYVGFGSGNLWKTTNNGLAWKPIFEDQPSTGIEQRIGRCSMRCSIPRAEPAGFPCTMAVVSESATRFTPAWWPSPMAPRWPTAGCSGCSPPTRARE